MSLLALLLLVQSQSFELEMEAPEPVARASSRPAAQASVFTRKPAGSAQWDLGQPATRASKKLLELTESIDATRTDTLYSHRTHVRRKDGLYHFDCSGMINWMLERVAPKALASID